METPAAAWWRSIEINRTALRLLFKSPWKAPFRQSENELLQIWLQRELSATFPMLSYCIYAGSIGGTGNQSDHRDRPVPLLSPSI